MVRILELLLTTVAGMIFLVSLGLWAAQLGRRMRGEPLLSLEPRRPVPWNVIDLLLIGVTAVAVVSISQWWCIRTFNLPPGQWGLTDLNPAQQVTLITVFSGGSLFIWLVAIMICRWRAKATAADLGWQAAHWQHDVVLGMAAYAMLIVPVLLLHFALDRLLPSDKSHPFVDLITADPRLEYLLPIAAAALLAAPLVEEFFFRVLLQGWLERLFAAHENPPVPQRAADGSPFGDAFEESAQSPPWPWPADGSAPLVTPPGFSDDRPADSSLEYESIPERALPEQAAWRWAPIVISALAFSLAHFGQGPAPISLFLLALGLGYLYQRTHRLLPSLVVHFLVNLTAVIQLALAVVGHAEPLP